MTEPVDRRQEISALIYLTVGIFLGISYYFPAAKTGALGTILVKSGQALFGALAFILPVLFIYMAIERFLARQPRFTSERFRYVTLLLISIAGLLHTLTIDFQAFRQLSIPTGADEPSAWQSLRILFQSAVEPDRFAELSKLKSGGLLGGVLSQAMSALAGTTGAAIIISAFILVLMVLLFNVSYARAINRTAQAFNSTRDRVSGAMRNSVETMRQNAVERENRRESYNLQIEQAGAASDSAAAAELEGQYPPSGTGDFVFSTEYNDAGEPPVPEFLRQAAEPAENTGGFVTMPDLNRAGATEVKHSLSHDFADESIDDEAETAYEMPLPAGVHRVDATAADYTDTAGQTGQVSVQAAAGVASENAAGSAAGSALAGPGGAAAGSAGADVHIPKHMRADQIPIPYQKPPLHLLNTDSAAGVRQNLQRIPELGRKLEATLKSFGVDAKVVNYTAGATITRFELTPGPGVKVSKIVGLADDIALNLAAMAVRIEAPIPGKSAIGIEIPNKETTPVLLRAILESPEFARAKTPLTAALGRDIQGTPILCDLTRMPHLLIAGATGSGKSVCLNTILMSILFRCTPDDVRLLMIDPKVVELSMYNGIPHLLSPVVTDPRKAANTLLWAVNEMVRRYGLFAEKKVRDIQGYRNAARAQPDEFEPMPLILIVIDELADLMSTSPTEVEDAIARLTAMARAAGIHLIIATQRPSVDVITGVIKANIPSRIAFAVASQVDSRTILDMGGAEKLLGKGDMLYFPQNLAKPLRGQGAFVSDSEVEKVLKFIKSNSDKDYDEEITEAINTPVPSSGKGNGGNDQQDELLPQAAELVVEAGYASVSLIQRRMNVGYPRAARLIDRMQEKGYVGPFEGSKPRKVLLTVGQLMELKNKGEL